MSRQERNYSKRVLIRNAERNIKRRERMNRSPLDQLTSNISVSCDTLFNEYFNGNVSLLRRHNIKNDPDLIKDLIETKFSDNTLSEQQILGLNPSALVGGFLILDGKYIDNAKVAFICGQTSSNVSAMDFFKQMKVKKEDIIRYGRFWSSIL